MTEQKTVFKDLETPIFESYKDKQRYFKRFKRTFIRSTKDFSVKGVITTISNRYMSVLSGFNPINQQPMYKEIKLTNN